MKVQIITLPEAKERQEKITKSFNEYNINFEFKSGVALNECSFIEENGTHYILFENNKIKINEDKLLENTNRNWIRFGEIAAYIAHYKLWKAFLNTNDSSILICEDDAKPNANIEFFESLICNDLYFINLQNVTAHNQSKQFLYRQPFVEQKNDNLIEYKAQLPLLCEGLAAYLLTRAGAQLMCDYIEENGYVGPNDCMITKLCQNKIMPIHAPIKLDRCFGLEEETYFTSYTHSGSFKTFKSFNKMVLQVKE
jgi:GR25 family glycosyltransferase involved in LPS biosynthesis